MLAPIGDVHWRGQCEKIEFCGSGQRSRWASKYANAHCVEGEFMGMSEVEVVE